MNYTWLENLNLPAPTTVDELYNTLVAFRDNAPNIDQYVNEMVAAFITGNKSVDKDFDSFLNDLKKMGLNRYLEIVQKTYDEAYGK